MTYRQVLREIAYDTHGVITTADAAAAGVPAVELRKLAARGALSRITYGVYRMLEVPSGDLDEYAEAVAVAGPDAVLADEAVLAAHDLAHVNLRRIRVATPRRVRTKLPATVEVVHKDIPATDRDSVDGVPAMSIPAALISSRGRVMTERLIDAAHDAARRRLISADQETAVVKELSTT